jgi:hypothetical protein
MIWLKGSFDQNVLLNALSWSLKFEPEKVKMVSKTQINTWNVYEIMLKIRSIQQHAFDYNARRTGFSFWLFLTLFFEGILQ